MDILQDNTRAILSNICENAEVPRYVLDSEAIEKKATYEFRDTLFADPVHRRHPIDSKASTWLSAAYFAKTAELDYKSKETRDCVETNIKRAAKIYGIQDDVEKVMHDIRTPKTEKSAADIESNWGCFKRRAYPMFDEEGVKLANAYFKDNCYALDSETRHEVARNIIRKCAEYGLQYNDTVRMEAGVGLPDRDFLVFNLEDRARRCKDAEQRKLVEKLAEEAKSVPENELMEHVDGLISAIEELDAQNGLDTKYGRDVLPPSNFCCDISIEEADDQIDDSVELDGDVLSIAELAKIPESVYEDALGADFVKRVFGNESGIDKAKLADELRSLPKPDQKALVRSLKEYAD